MARHLNWSFWEGIFRGSGGLFYALNQPVSPPERPNAFFGLPELISAPLSTCTITTLVDPTRPPSRAQHPPAASGCVRGVPCRSTHSIFAWNSTFHPNIWPPHPSFRASALRRFALQCNERLGVRTQRMSMDIDPRTPHVPLINTEQLLEVEKTSFQYSPDISCMCLLRGLNGHIRVIYLASRQTASSWRPKLSSSSLDAHCPPLEAWYLGCIRIASHAIVYPLTCEEAEGG